MTDAPDDPADEPKVASVSGKILEQYFVTLGATEGFEVIASRLRNAVATKGPSNEIAVRAALFDNDAA